MDLLTSSPTTDEQQELSARALRACLAAEAALASLRAECLPLQSSLPRLGEAGSTNLELGHRSLQLQIDACESFTLCATAAFKQLCDARFLPSSRKQDGVKFVQSSSPSATQSCSLPCAQMLDDDYRKAKSKMNSGTCNSKSQTQIQEEASTVFGNCLSSLMSSDSEEAPGDSQSPHMLIPASIIGSGSLAPSESYSHKPLQKEVAGRLDLSDYKTPREFAGRVDGSPSKASTQNSSTPHVAPVKESSAGIFPEFGFEVKEMTMTPFEGQESLACSSSKDSAEGLVPAHSNSFLNLSAQGFQLSATATPLQTLESPHCSSLSANNGTGKRESLKRDHTMLPSLSSTISSPVSNQRTAVTDHASPVPRCEAGGIGICNRVPNSASHPSCIAGHMAEKSNCSGSAEVPLSSKTSQSYKIADCPSPTATQFGYVESAGASVVTPGIVGQSATPPNIRGCGHEGYASNFTAQSATSQFVGSGHSHEYNKNGQFLHLQQNSCASSAFNSGFLSTVDSLDSDRSQDRRSNANNGKLGEDRIGLDSSSSPSMGLVKPRGRTYVTPSTSLNMQFSQTAASFVNPKAAAYECGNPGLPRAALATSAGYGEPSWGCSALPQAAVTYQMWPYNQTFDIQSQFGSESSTFATSGFAAVQPLTSLKQTIMPESASTVTLANDLKNWQVVTRLDAEFPTRKSYNHCSKANLEQKVDYDGGFTMNKERSKWSEIHASWNQSQRVEAGLLEIDSEDNTDDDGEEDDYEGILLP